MAEASLKPVLHAYGVQVDGVALNNALEDPKYGPVLLSWARDHLVHDNLLTKDELAIYTNLEQSGKVDLLTDGDLAAVLSLNNRDVEHAIEELNQSTTTITRQIETLKLQQDALSRLVQTHTKTEGARLTMEAKQIQKWSSECKSLTSTVAELTQRIEFQVTDLEQSKQSGISGIHQSVDGLLESDDRLLASLQKLGWELETEDPEEEESVEKLREVCARLIKFTVETIRTKLDRTFLESLHAARRSSKLQGSSATAQEVSTLQDEVESLYSEILAVAQMSVEQQYLEPALKSLSEKNGQSVTRTSEAITYVDQCLDYILEHLLRLSLRITQYRVHQDTIALLLETTKAELAVCVEPPVVAKPEPSTFSSPSRRRRSSGDMSPVRHRVTRRRSSGRFEEAGGHPLDVFLDHLALSLVPDKPTIPVTPGPNSGSTLTTQLNPMRALQVTGDHVCRAAAVLSERSDKASDVVRSVQDAIESGASTHIADARRAVQMMWDEVLAETPYGRVNLIDPEIEGSIAVLRQEVDTAKARTAQVEGGIAKVAASGKRDEFVSRWGR